MNLARRLTEAGPGLRWHLARPRTAACSTAARSPHIGAGTVIVAPRVLRGVDRISIGSDCAVYSGVWLACEEGRPDPSPSATAPTSGHAVHLHAIDPVTIGRGCVLADGVYVTTSDHDRADRLATHGTGPTTIGDDVFIGQRAVVLGGVTIGAGATVAAHAVVTATCRPAPSWPGSRHEPCRGGERPVSRRPPSRQSGLPRVRRGRRRTHCPPPGTTRPCSVRPRRLARAGRGHQLRHELPAPGRRRSGRGLRTRRTAERGRRGARAPPRRRRRGQGRPVHDGLLGRARRTQAAPGAVALRRAAADRARRRAARSASGRWRRTRARRGQPPQPGRRRRPPAAGLRPPVGAQPTGARPRRGRVRRRPLPRSRVDARGTASTPGSRCGRSDGTGRPIRSTGCAPGARAAPRCPQAATSTGPRPTAGWPRPPPPSTSTATRTGSRCAPSRPAGSARSSWSTAPTWPGSTRSARRSRRTPRPTSWSTCAERARADLAWAEGLREAGRRRTLAEHTFDHRVAVLEALWAEVSRATWTPGRTGRRRLHPCAGSRRRVRAGPPLAGVVLHAAATGPATAGRLDTLAPATPRSPC